MPIIQANREANRYVPKKWFFASKTQRQKTALKGEREPAQAAFFKPRPLPGRSADWHQATPSSDQPRRKPAIGRQTNLKAFQAIF